MNDLEQFLNYNQNFFGILGIALLVLVAFWVAGHLLGKKLMPAIAKKIDAQKHPFAELILHGFGNPVRAFMAVAGVCVAVLILASWNAVNVPGDVVLTLSHAPDFVYKVLRVAAIICITWGLLSSSNVAGLLLRRARSKMDLHLSTSATRFLAGLFKIVVLIVAVVILLSEFNYNISGLIAGLGLGGLTIALAAQDSASNFFGGLVLVFDNPFEIGDWVVCGDVEGTVEDINMRSTAIRDASGSLTTVPNAMLSAKAITNFSSAMNQRRADVSLNLVYGTTHKKMQNFISAVRDMLEQDAEVVSDSVLVRFSEFSPSSLDVRIIFYTSLSAFNDHMRIRERVNYAILDIAGEQGIAFAYPTRTVEVKNDDSSDDIGKPGA